MNYTSEVDLIDHRRGVLAVVVAILSTLFNYGDAVETFTDMVVWFVFLTVGVYVVFTALSMVFVRIWK